MNERANNYFFLSRFELGDEDENKLMSERCNDDNDDDDNNACVLCLCL